MAGTLPPANKPKRSLWTTPTSELTNRTRRPFVDKSVTAEKIREAVAATKERADVFSSRVSDDVLRTPVE